MTTVRSENQAGGSAPTPPTADVRRRLYVDEGLSIAEVGRRLDTSYDQGRLRLHRYGVPVRPVDGSRPPRSSGRRWRAVRRSGG